LRVDVTSSGRFDYTPGAGREKRAQPCHDGALPARYSGALHDTCRTRDATDRNHRLVEGFRRDALRERAAHVCGFERNEARRVVERVVDGKREAVELKTANDAQLLLAALTRLGAQARAAPDA